MAGDTSVLAEHMSGSNDMGISGINLLHFAIPLAGILAVRLDEFLHGEMLIGIMPVHPCVGMKVFIRRDVFSGDDVA